MLVGSLMHRAVCVRYLRNPYPTLLALVIRDSRTLVGFLTALSEPWARPPAGSSQVMVLGSGIVLVIVIVFFMFLFNVPHTVHGTASPGL